LQARGLDVWFDEVADIPRKLVAAKK
jgi:hypothetical protein